MQASIERQVIAHGERLKSIFNLPSDRDPVNLCRQLRRLEREGQTIAEGLCNIPNFQDEADRRGELLLDRLDKILNFRRGNIPVFHNLDPRGYALKIESDWSGDWNRAQAIAYVDRRIYQDFGGFGIIAPEFKIN